MVRVIQIVRETMLSVTLDMEVEMTFPTDCREEDGVVILKSLRGDQE